jgi:uncharacterized membrane protein
MRARTIFIVLLVLILVFALWPTALSMGAAWIAQLAIWLAMLLIYLVIRFIRSRRTQSG